MLQNSTAPITDKPVNPKAAAFRSKVVDPESKANPTAKTESRLAMVRDRLLAESATGAANMAARASGESKTIPTLQQISAASAVPPAA